MPGGDLPILTRCCKILRISPGSNIRAIIFISQLHFEGECGEGGPGHDYVIIRYDVTKLGNLFPKGTNVQLISWSEATSFDSSGNEFYHHFAFDDVGITTWTLPQ